MDGRGGSEAVRDEEELIRTALRRQAELASEHRLAADGPALRTAAEQAGGEHRAVVAFEVIPLRDSRRGIGHVHGVDANVAFGMPLRLLRTSGQREELGPQRPDDAQFHREREAVPRGRRELAIEVLALGEGEGVDVLPRVAELEALAAAAFCGSGFTGSTGLACA